MCRYVSVFVQWVLQLLLLLTSHVQCVCVCMNSIFIGMYEVWQCNCTFSEQIS